MSVRFRLVNMLLQERQELVAQRVPEIEHAVRLADEPAAVDHVGPVVDDRLEQLEVVLPGRIPGRRPARARRRRSARLKPSRRAAPFALVHRLVDDLEVGAGEQLRQLVELLAPCRRSSSR